MNYFTLACAIACFIPILTFVKAAFTAEDALTMINRVLFGCILGVMLTIGCYCYCDYVGTTTKVTTEIEECMISDFSINDDAVVFRDSKTCKDYSLPMSVCKISSDNPTVMKVYVQKAYIGKYNFYSKSEDVGKIYYFK